MKRKPTPASLRTGQTLFYLVPPLVSPNGLWWVASIAVGSDKRTGAEPSNSVRRTYAAQVVGLHSCQYFYSRRQALTAARVKNETSARKRRAMLNLFESSGILQVILTAIIKGCSEAHAPDQEAAVEAAQ
jgi:hypothetical protein